MTPATPITPALQRSEDSLVFTTQDRERWKGVALRQHVYTSDFWTQRPVHNECHVAYFPMGKSRLIQKRCGKIHDARIFPGMCIIVPRGYDAVYEGEAMRPTVIDVPHDLLSKAAEEIGTQTKANYEIINIFEACDATIGHLTNLLLIELARPAHPAQALFTDGISNALAAHLLRSYNAYDIKEYMSPGLGQHLLCKVIAYIEDHTDTPIRLDDLANIAGVSRFHFSRLFKLSTGKSPMAYVTGARIRNAQQLILSGRHTLAEIALMVGFADQSHFTRQFQIYTDCTPAVYARNKGIRLFRTSE